VAAPLKLTDEDIKWIRRRVRKGEHQSDLARQFGVNRKTIRRRLDTLERAETDKAERLAEERLRRQAAREKRKLYERERDSVVGHPVEPGATRGSASQRRTPATRRKRAPNPYYDWLDRPKNLSGRAASEARGLVRLRSPDGIIRKAAEREAVEALLEAGWVLDDSFWDERTG
jgi:hypothetical protein